MEHLTQKELDRKQQKAEWYQRNKARINSGIKVTKKTEEEKKAHKKLYLKEYGQRPEVKARRHEANQRPEVKTRNAERALAHRDENRDEYNAGQRERYKTEKSVNYRKSYYLKRKAEGYYDNEEYKEKQKIYQANLRVKKSLAKLDK